MSVDLVALAGELTLVNNEAGRSARLLTALVEPPELELTIDGASTLKFTVADHRRQLITDPTLNQRSWAVVGGVHFELVGVSKSGDHLNVTMEDAIVAALRRRTKKLSVGAGKTTRRAFTAKLCKEAEVPYIVDPSHRGKVQTPLQRSADGQKTSSWEVLGSEVAAPIQWRRFSDGRQLVMGGDAWLMSGYKKPVPLRENAAGVGSIDFDIDVGKPAQTATLTIDTDHTSFGPGTPVALSDLGPGDGEWLVSRITRRLTSTRASVELIRAQKVLDEPKKKRKGRGAGGSNRDGGSPDFVPGKTGSDSGGTAGNSGRSRMVDFALAQKGKPYVWGGNGPDGYDCSGLVQAATRAGGRTLGKPAASQWNTCRSAGKTIPVSTALRTRGALLFRIGGEYDHVAISLGNGQTVEAMGSAYGCGVFNNAASRGWTGAALWL